jgi:hypothetical protein
MEVQGALSLDANSVAKFRAIAQTSVDEQARTFLRSFVLDFHGRFEEVLDLAEEFKRFGPKDQPFGDLEEDKAHLFLEKRRETLTVTALRQYLKVSSRRLLKSLSTQWIRSI